MHAKNGYYKIIFDSESLKGNVILLLLTPLLADSITCPQNSALVAVGISVIFKGRGHLVKEA